MINLTEHHTIPEQNIPREFSPWFHPTTAPFAPDTSAKRHLKCYRELWVKGPPSLSVQTMQLFTLALSAPLPFLWCPVAPCSCCHLLLAQTVPAMGPVTVTWVNSMLTFSYCPSLSLLPSVFPSQRSFSSTVWPNHLLQSLILIFQIHSGLEDYNCLIYHSESS